MAIYVDRAFIPYRGHLMCHMIADTFGELHGMADAIGMQRRWFQPRSFPHYDVPQDRRVLALRLGAAEVDRREIVMVMRRLRADPEFVAALDRERARHAALIG